MGYYIEGPAKGKVDFLVINYNARIVREGEASSLLSSPDSAVVCVVDNGPFEAAALAYDKSEFNRFSRPLDERPRVWLALSKTVAHKLANFPG